MVESSDYTKPLPLMQGFTKEFYGWCARGELRFQRCSECKAWRHVPRELCARCGSWQWSWERSSGRGKIFTWTVVERPLHPDFVDDLPYACVVVEMNEGVRLIARMSDRSLDELEIGREVEVVFETVAPEVALPRFRLGPS